MSLLFTLKRYFPTVRIFDNILQLNSSYLHILIFFVRLFACSYCLRLFKLNSKILGPPPLNLGPPLIPSSRSPLIYLVGPLAISDPHINICVRPPNTCVALKQFNLLPPNTLLWSNFTYYPLTHQFVAITHELRHVSNDFNMIPFITFWLFSLLS